MVIGYTTGVFDLFHVGHVRLLRNAKAMCDKLIVGVSTDELVWYKNKQPVITFEDRKEVVANCKHVDLVVPQETMDKLDAHDRYKFDIMFVGDDWYKTDKWDSVETQLADRHVKVIYFPYTNKTSSTLINKTLENLRTE
ncbi:adenylyltransferase/cytidyltransferase family protein [Thalassorhabdomicrobium marinisediminis]|uniref:Glycerol-3-phosphate cytidylyltransferase n=1 Tax=Thalassorhabdomicrobium marinisediminis TaxID=2170577 RepID=A0A2T7FWD8_9RHOB|nr:adenylyltransferase/cytidyltransferase family protein [Thalassorhabdomicrobium marinisediminis]PVA06481.1 glycerol-3-phosphate cytidylyltransferase [Thalassorhabdomicrobium marinisediminis]